MARRPLANAEEGGEEMEGTKRSLVLLLQEREALRQDRQERQRSAEGDEEEERKAQETKAPVVR